MGTKEYGKSKPVTTQRGKQHKFFGITLDFGIEVGACHVIQESHIKDMLEVWPDKLKGNSPTPAGQDLFKRGAGGLLSDAKMELFHTVVAKGIFVTKRSCPDIYLRILVLFGRVRDPNREDWRKYRQILDYLKQTIANYLILRVGDGLGVVNWWVGASFAVHDDFRSHSGGIMMMSKDGVSIVTVSTSSN